MAEIGIVCGIARERQALGAMATDPAFSVAVSGARPDRAEAQAWQMVAEGCRLLVSWGIAGGLDPSLAPGDLLYPRSVVDSDGTCRGLRPDLAGEAGTAPILGLDDPVMSVRAKAALAETGAAAVDMETHRLALVGEAAGVPVLAIRAIADPAQRSLPAFAANAVDEAGEPRFLSVVLGLLRRPVELPALLRVKSDADQAIAALAGAAPRILPKLRKWNDA